METSVRDVRRFTPASYEGKDGAPVYLLAPLTFRSRARFQAALTGSGIRFPDNAELARESEALIRELGLNNQDELLEVVAGFRDNIDATPITERPASPSVEEGQPPPETTDEQAAWDAEFARRAARDIDFNALLDVLRSHQRIARLLEFRVLYQQLSGPIAASFGLAGWEGVPAKFRRLDGVVPDDVLDQIPEEDLRAIGLDVIATMFVSAAQRGN